MPGDRIPYSVIAQYAEMGTAQSGDPCGLQASFGGRAPHRFPDLESMAALSGAKALGTAGHPGSPD